MPLSNGDSGTGGPDESLLAKERGGKRTQAATTGQAALSHVGQQPVDPGTHGNKKAEHGATWYGKKDNAYVAAIWGEEGAHWYKERVCMGIK